ncbi:thioether cross-link-forming SCIFF peptide maturase [Desulfotomaculum defluvii]
MQKEPKIHIKLFNSQFMHIFVKDNVVCLVHSLTLNKVYGGELLKLLYQEFNEKNLAESVINKLATKFPAEDISNVIKDLVEKEMLISDSEQDIAKYTSLFYQGLNLNQIQHLYLLPTTNCNLRCKYCFVEDDDRPFQPQYMTREIARKGLEVFAKLTDGAENISINFYGGEPLLNEEVLYFAMRYVRELEQQGAFIRPVMMTLLTNGTLVDQKTVDYVLETRSNVSVSVDGPSIYHDLNRKDNLGQGSFSKAIEGYLKLKEAGAKPGISCTLGHDSLEHIEEIVQYIIKEIKPSGMGFNILLPNLCCKNNQNYSYELASKKVIEAFTILRQYGIYEDRMMRRVNPFVNKSFHYKDCMGVGGQIVLTPEGKIGPCQGFTGMDEFFPLHLDELYAKISTLASTDIYQNHFFHEWMHRFPLNMEKCADCYAIAICGGGCPYASYVTHDTIWGIDERVCFQAKNSFEWMLWDTYAHMIGQ